MTRTNKLVSSLLALAVAFAAGNAGAHCDGADGPVAKAVREALETGNVALVLPYAPAEAEAELEATFADALKARALGPDARKVADRLFLETAIRLHRAGEGAPFTGVKPAGLDYGPAIPAAEQALEAGDAEPVVAVLREELAHALSERLRHVRELREVAAAPSDRAGIAADRERISAELGFITYVEGVHRAIIGATPAHREE